MASTAELRKTYTDAVKGFYGTGAKPVYAYLGAWDLTRETIEGVPAKVREELTVEKIKGLPAKVREELTSLDVKKLTAPISELPRDPRKLGAKLTDSTVEQIKAADARYGDLVTRGESAAQKLKDTKPTDLVEKAKAEAQKVVDKVKNVRGGAAPVEVKAPTAARKTAAKTTAPAADKVNS